MGVDASVSIADGRVTMNAEVSSPTVRLHIPDHQPLSRKEVYATLEMADDDVRISLDFNSQGLDELVASLPEFEDDD